GVFVARTARCNSTVERAELGAESVDVFHQVDLADARPVGRADRPGRRAHRPERRPVASRGGTGDGGLLQGCFEAQLATWRRGEVGALGLDPAAGPVAGRVPDRLDDQVTLAVLVHVGGAVGHGFDLAGAPVRGATGVAGAEV